MRQILCLSHTPWQARPNRTQQLLTRLSGAQVLFFEPAPKKGEPMPEQGRRMRANLIVYTLPAPLPDPRAPHQRRKLDKAADFIMEAMARHHIREPVLWCTAPVQAGFLDRLAYRGLVYDCHCFWGDHFIEEESDLTRHAEVVFAASPGLAFRLSPCNDNIALLPNGVNPLLFNHTDSTAPTPIARLNGEVILCKVGDLNSRVDFSPLLYAARRKPEWDFVLIGRYTQKAVQKLAGLTNVHLLGSVHTLDLPDYLSACHLLFDLLQTDPDGSDVVPARVYEYLAAGKPSVIMSRPDRPEPFPELVYTAYDEAGFLRRCDQGLREDPDLMDRRRRYAEKCSWANRAAQVSKILNATGLFED